MGRVEGKVALITGAARGMGAAHAKRLIEEGAKVMLTDVLDKEGKATVQAIGSADARYLHLDVTKESEWQMVVAETEAAFGPISVLVNNAGISTFSPIESYDEALFRRVIDVNQIGVFLGMKSVIPSMRKTGGGSIINISSAAGLYGITHASAYCASKFAVRGLTKSAAIELAPLNIRVNSVHPGLIRTPMTAATGENEMTLSGVAAAPPAGRVGEPEEVAAIVVLLASDESRFSTGAEFVVDGGISCQ